MHKTLVERSLDIPVHPYATLAYANTLIHVGQPIYVPAWQTHVIARRWNARAVDAMGPYPITCLAIDSDLSLGLEQLREGGLVSVVLVVDGLLGPPIGRLRETFSFVRPFKTHYLIDDNVGPYQPSDHHLYEIQRAARRGVEVRMISLLDNLDEWAGLYDELIARHNIAGVQRYSRASFQALSQCEGLIAVAAFLGKEIVSCHLWFKYRAFAWSHLAATNSLGYKNSAAFAVYDYSIRNFSGHIINLGGGVGFNLAKDDGLSRFKAGFSNRQNDAYLCGAILDSKMYRTLCGEPQISGSDYFPAYRAPTSSA